MTIATTAYPAPWGTSLKVISAVSSLLLMATAIFGLFTGPQGNGTWILSMVILPLSILLVTALFTIRGYVLTPDTLLVKRLAWNTQVPLHGLTAVEADSDAMKRSMRTMGNGGLFSISGFFRNQKLGSYRALATDRRHCVILKFDRKVIVITPEKPQAFVQQLKDMKGIA